MTTLSLKLNCDPCAVSPSTSRLECFLDIWSDAGYIVTLAMIQTCVIRGQFKCCQMEDNVDTPREESLEFSDLKK